jgi:basic membrane lipoprotein Med (substrate-binding protein (PBP1-ABC) superfamily)
VISHVSLIHRVVVALGAAVLAVSLTACAGGTDAIPSGVTSSAASAPAGGSPTPNADQYPAPGSTVAAQAADATAVPVPDGLVFTVVLPEAGSEVDPHQRAAAVTALQNYAAEHAATVTTLVIDPGTDPDAALQQAVAHHSSLIVTFGPDILDALDRISASTLGQHFLIVGAQLPEPTGNVTAVVWPGAAARAAAATGAPRLDGASGLADHASVAISLGVAAVVAGRTGIVLALPA